MEHILESMNLLILTFNGFLISLMAQEFTMKLPFQFMGVKLCTFKDHIQLGNGQTFKYSGGA
jgi:hypothetical protein